MRIWMILTIAIGLLFGAFKLLETVKFDTAIAVSVVKGPFKGLSFKLIDYKVSMNDLKSMEHNFWKSRVGRNVFDELSTTLQTVILAAQHYVSVDLHVNYFGLLQRSYRITSLESRLGILTAHL